MPFVCRISIPLCFFFLALLLIGCGRQSPPADPNAIEKKPLATPELVSDRPKIVLFGDSLTAGFGLLEKESYPYLLQEKLKAAGYNYEVVNAGVSGDTSLGGTERIDWVLEMDRVEILVLELGANDLLRGVPVDDMKANLDAIIKKAKAKNVRILLCGMFAPPTMGIEYQRSFMKAFPDLATENRINYLPFLLQGVAMNKDLNQADGIHPNAEGEKIMTENVYQELKKMLEPPAPSGSATPAAAK
ncbi:MAG: arylesterase [Chloracidobacterium sp.]|nr:arylesterase [Chloracidobacterium sp.]MCO5333457.1 arylesterase [Pyrinomonadaceae bacterium]